jgi:GntR family transcriptional regulator, arabinose operon transcriptional repressor
MYIQEVTLINQVPDTPLYLKIRDALRSEILEKPYQTGDPFYSEGDLVAKYGVARGTIRQALSTLEQEGYIRREKGRGTFVSLKGFSPDQANTTTISFIVPHFRDSYVPTILLGVEAAARECGVNVLFRHAESDPDLQSRLIREAVEYGSAGILLFPVDSTYHDPILLQYLASGFPIVVLDHYFAGVDTDYVISDGYGGMLRAVQHLLGLGHRQIGFVTWDLNRAGEMGRYLGYQQALREWKIEPAPDLTCNLPEYPVDDLSALTAFLARSDRPTAIVALNDYLAVKVMRACRDAGLKIPGDLALIGFDDTDIAAQMEIPLTSVSQPIHEIGAQAIRILVNKIKENTQETQRVVLPTHLVIRESSGGVITSTPSS